MKTIDKAKIKKGDTVYVRSGKDKGKTGEVIMVDPLKGRIVVSGVNIVKKHERPNPKNEKGGIVEKEAAVSYSNVQLLSAKTGKGVRVSIERKDGKAQRLSRKTKETF